MNRQRILISGAGIAGYLAASFTAEGYARRDEGTYVSFARPGRHRMPHWTEGRVALIGDAAHSPSLLAGAGAAFAMLGAYVLAEELHQAEGNIMRAFLGYERRLRPFILRQQRAATRFAASFAPRTALGIRIRDAAVNLMNRPLVGAFLARRMFGNSFPLTLA